MTTSALSERPGRVSAPNGGSHRAAIDYQILGEIRRSVGIRSCPSSLVRLLHPTVQIAPAELVKRVGTGCPGWFVETICAPIGSRLEFEFQGPVHLLIMYNEGSRRDGETSIDGFAPSKTRTLTRKLTFVPVGRGYRERLEAAVPTRLTFLYLDPTVLRNDEENNYPARVHFEDSAVWETSAKLKSAIENGQTKKTFYLSALSNVLAIEMSGSEANASREAVPIRGGLACWQRRTVLGYIQEHLSEQICVATLARLARLSQHHFCRAFKKSFGIPPHQYHVRSRVEQAKLLLSDRSLSITDVGLSLGFSQTSTFSVVFHKITGSTPSEFRRELK